MGRADEDWALFLRRLPLRNKFIFLLGVVSLLRFWLPGPRWPYTLSLAAFVILLLTTKALPPDVKVPKAIAFVGQFGLLLIAASVLYRAVIGGRTPSNALATMGSVISLIFYFLAGGLSALVAARFCAGSPQERRPTWSFLIGGVVGAIVFSLATSIWADYALAESSVVVRSSWSTVFFRILREHSLFVTVVVAPILAILSLKLVRQRI